MQQRCHDDFVFPFDHFIDHSIWKSLGISPANILCTMSPRIEQWVIGERVQDTDDLLYEFAPEARLLSIVPICRFGYIIMKLGTKLDLPHLFKM